MKKKKTRSYWLAELVEEEAVIIPEPTLEPYYAEDIPTMVHAPVGSLEPPLADSCNPPAEEAIITEETAEVQVIETLPVSTEALRASKQS